jgi:hypothetical protein
VKQLIHRGVVQVSGFLVEDQARVLQLWEPGARLHRQERGWLLRLSRPRWLDTTTAPALPLVLQKQSLCALPLPVKMSDPPSGLVYARGGELVVERFGQLEDPSTFLDLGEFTLVPTQPPPAAAIEQVAAPPAATVDRNSFGTVGAPPPEVAGVLAALAKARAPSLSLRIPSLLARLGGFLARFLAPRPSLPGPYVPPSPPTPPSRLWRALRGLFTRALGWTRLWRLIGRQQAEYLRKLMELLEGGDLAEGLRRAIPLGGKGGGDPAQTALGLPARRDQLQISLSSSGSAASMMLVDDLYAELRKLYRQAFQRAERNGDIEQAAFVLAELLREDEEAVNFLERHGRLKLAAELAEARGLPPGLVVRQWFRAGEFGRALRIAEHHGVFADAVVRLERTHADEARSLRLLWADRLAARGDYSGAVLAALWVPEAKALLRGWIDRALAVGGTAAARMLLLRLQVAPDESELVRDQALQLLQDRSAQTRVERRTLMQEVASARAHPLLRPLSRAAVRALAREGGPAELRERLLSVANDGALSVDITALPRRSPPVPRAWTREIAAEDRGTLEVRDVYRLPSGRLLVALGELGVRIYGGGRVQTHFDAPAERLVRADHGDRALAIGDRGSVLRVTPLDLVARRRGSGFDVPTCFFATEFDGASWFTGSDGAVQELDLEGERPKIRWRVGELGLGAARLIRTPEQLTFVVMSLDGAPEIWSYQLPSLLLRRRHSPDGGVPLGLSADGERWACYLPAEALPPGSPHDGPQVLLVSGGNRAVLTNDGGGAPAEVLIVQKWVVVRYDDGERGTRIVVYDNGAVWGTLQLGGVRRASLRLDGDFLEVGDALGRVLVVDLPSGEALTDLRLNA